MKKQLLIVDDHALIRQGVKSKVEQVYSDSNITMVESAEQALVFMAHHKVDVLLSDISMQGMNGIELCKMVKEKYPSVKVIIVTQHKQIWMVKQLYALNADGLVHKEDSLDELELALKACEKGERYFAPSINSLILTHLVSDAASVTGEIVLTMRERAILNLIAQEFTTKEIADQLHIGEKTIETHRKNLLLKFEVRNMVGLVRKAMELGLLD